MNGPEQTQGGIGAICRKLWNGKFLSPLTGKTLFSRAAHQETRDVANCFLHPTVNPPSAADIIIGDGSWALDLTRTIATAGTAGGMNFRDLYSAANNYAVGDMVWLNESANSPRVPYVCLIANGPATGAGVQAPTYPEPGTVYWRNAARFFFDLTTGVLYNPGILDGTPSAIRQAPNGDVYVAGSFWRIQMTDHFGNVRYALRNGLAVLTASMNVREPHWYIEEADTGDSNSGNVGNSFILGFTTAGKPMIAGTFDHVNRVKVGRGSSFGGSGGGSARLNIDGSCDTGFNPGNGLDGFIGATSYNNHLVGFVDSSNGIIVPIGVATNWNGTAITNNGIIRVDSTGAYDPSFAPSAGPGPSFLSGPIIPFGTSSIFCSCPGEGVRKISQSSGATDGTFSTGAGMSGVVTEMAISGSNLYIAMNGGTYDGTTWGFLIRVDAGTGTIDPGFTPAFVSLTNPPVIAVAIQGSKILVGGTFSTVNGVTRNCMARLNPDGSTDTTWTTGTGSNLDSIYQILVLADGSIAVIGSFSTIGGLARQNIARMDKDGNVLGV